MVFDHISAATFDPGANDGAGNDYYQLMIQTPGSSLPSGGAVGQLVQKASTADYSVMWGYTDAGVVSFEPATGSALTSSNVADALDELSGNIATVVVDADNVTYTPSTASGLTSTNVQDALDEIGSSGGAGGIPEAPTDGVQYGRQSAAWTPVVSGGGGGGTPSTANPLMDGTAAPGTATPYSREDHVHPTDTSRAPLASPTFTGAPAAPTVSPGTDSTTKIATTAFVQSAVAAAGGAAPSGANPIMDGTAAPGSSALYSRGDHVHPSDTTKAPLASPTFTGVPAAPTAATATNTTQIATTAFVAAAISAGGGGSGASVLVSDTPPPSPAANSLWWESDTGNLYIYYNDGNSSQWVIVAGGGTVNAVTFTPQTLTAPQQKQARSNIGVNDSSVIINGDFRVNQIGYVSGAALAAGIYGHDQWKAGASGGDYSFTQLKSSTQITIAAGKSLIQPIEDVKVAGGSYVLSWTGTAQARAGVNTLTPSGSYAASPLLITGQTAGTVMSVEFNSGTLGTVKLETGANATPFIMRPFDQELVTCQRYWQLNYASVDFVATAASQYGVSPATFAPIMRATPSVAVFGTTIAPVNIGTPTFFGTSPGGVSMQTQSVAAGRNYWMGTISADARL